jgi:hypothetical protein
LRLDANAVEVGYRLIVWLSAEEELPLKFVLPA